MALTDEQRSGVRRYLGYSDLTQGRYSTREGAMESLSVSGEAQVVALLSDLELIEEQLRSSWTRQKVKGAEGVTLAGHDEILALRQEGRRLAETISTILGVPVSRTPFSSGSASGIAGRG